MKKREYDTNRVAFYSKEDMAGVWCLENAEPILKSEIKSVYADINDVLELYNIKQYFDNELYLKSWKQDDIVDFKQKATEYGKIVGLFMAKINDSNFMSYYEQLSGGYVDSFWKLLNDQQVYKRVSAENFAIILSEEPHEIRNILYYKNLLTHYDTTLRDFLLTYPQSAEILLSIYEQKNDFQDKEMSLPKSLSVQDKENIISTYLDSENPNLNYIQLIQKVRDRTDFKIFPKTKLKAQRKEKEQTEEFLNNNNNAITQYGVSVCFKEQMEEPLQISSEGLYLHYTYSLDFIKENIDDYSLFQNFKYLFFYFDKQSRIKLVCKKKDLNIFETLLIHSKNEYLTGTSFNLSEQTSLCQIGAYGKIINNLGNSLENTLQSVFTSIFQEKYNFASNARLTMPSPSLSDLEKVRLLAPEFESALKQYKLFVENGEIDFELLQISSNSCVIKDIPSLIPNKYIYLDVDNKEVVNCSHLFFSDQAMLAYVEPYKEKHYHTFFNLLKNEQVNFNSYADYQKPKLNYLIEKGMICLDENNYILVTNPLRIIILKDLYDNEFASFYHYKNILQEEAKRMADENMIVFESSLFAKPEQSYFNYYLNKSEFTNGLDLRNSYVHGTQANPEDIVKHQYAYFRYLKLLVLVLLKIEDDLILRLIHEKS
jgi:hypothetical protein